MWLRRDPDAADDGRAPRPAVVFAYLAVTALIVAGFAIQMANGQCPVP